MIEMKLYEIRVAEKTTDMKLYKIKGVVRALKVL